MRRRCAQARGFTLVEVMVAIFVMAIMAVMAWQAVDGVVRARAASQERLERTLRLNTVIAQWEQDLASIQDTSVVPSALSCDGASARMIRRTPSGLQVVVWTLRPDLSGAGAGGAVWDRWAGPSVTTTGQLQDSWLRSLQLQGGEPGQVRTLTGLDRWQIYFFQGNAWSNCQSTGNLAPSTVTVGGGFSVANPPSVAAPASSSASSATAAGGAGTPAVPTAPPRIALPQGVRLVLSFAPGSGANGDLTRDTLLGP